jgi:type IV pilus assembly protein PilM
MSITALDIGTASIKVLLAKGPKNITISKFVEVPNKLGLVYPQTDQEFAQFTELIANIFNDYKLDQSDVRLSLPEYLTASRVVEVPFLTDAELASAIDWQAEQYIPIPKNDLTLQYQVLERPLKKTENAKMKVLLVGTRKSIAEKMNNVFLTIGIEPTLLETQIFALIRTLDFRPEDPNTLLVQLGANTSAMAAIAAGQFDFSVSSKIGSQLITNAIAQNFNLDQAQAETYKINYGLDQKQLEGKVAAAALPIVEALCGEMQKAITFFNQNHQGQKISRIVLSGGPAQTIGLTEYISNKLGIETMLIAAFAAAKGSLPEQNQASYGVCVGLCMRQLI